MDLSTVNENDIIIIRTIEVLIARKSLINNRAY